MGVELIDDDYLEDEEGNIWICEDLLHSLNTDNDINTFIFQILSAIGLIISILLLLYTFVVYCCFGELQTRPGMFVMNLIFALILAKLIFVTGRASSLNSKVCYSTAILGHYFWLASFTWMSVLAWDIWRKFVSTSNAIQTRTGWCSIKCECVFGLGMPMVLVSITSFLDFIKALNLQYGTGETCWIGNKQNQIIFFVTPVIVTMVWNTACFMLTIRAIYITRIITQMVTPFTEDKQQHFIHIKLASLMGFPWIFGVLAAFLNHDALHYIFVSCNSLQGAYIAAAFGLNRKVRHMIYIKFRNGDG